MKKVIYAIGDIHGRLDCLTYLKKKISEDSTKYDDKMVVYLGDYVDRGPHSKEVIDNLIDEPIPGFKEEYIKGNHEDFMLSAMNNDATWNEIVSWLYHGGLRTLQSYGVDVLELIEKVPNITMEYYGQDTGIRTRVKEKLQPILIEVVGGKQIDFLNSLKLFHQEPGYIFVHAGVNPNKPFSEQTPKDLMWIRNEFLYSDKNYGVKIVHGHTPIDKVDIRSNRINVDTLAFDTSILSAIALTNGEEYVINTKFM